MKIVDYSEPWPREDNKCLMAGPHTFANADVPTAGTSSNKVRNIFPLLEELQSVNVISICQLFYTFASSSSSQVSSSFSPHLIWLYTLITNLCVQITLFLNTISEKKRIKLLRFYS